LHNFSHVRYLFLELQLPKHYNSLYLLTHGPQDMDISPLLTVANFCQAVGISRSTWHKLKRQGATPAVVTIGGIQRIRPEAARAWLAENEERAAADTAHKASEGPLPLTV